MGMRRALVIPPAAEASTAAAARVVARYNAATLAGRAVPWPSDVARGRDNRGQDREHAHRRRAAVESHLSGEGAGDCSGWSVWDAALRAEGIAPAAVNALPGAWCEEGQHIAYLAACLEGQRPEVVTYYY